MLLLLSLLLVTIVITYCDCVFKALNAKCVKLLDALRISNVLFDVTTSIMIIVVVALFVPPPVHPPPAVPLADVPLADAPLADVPLADVPLVDVLLAFVQLVVVSRPACPCHPAAGP